MLLAPLDFVHRQQYLHARQTLRPLLELGVVPVVNENDAVADDEIRFGDNDRLAALVAHLVGAELLVLLDRHRRAAHRRPAARPPRRRSSRRSSRSTTSSRRVAGGAGTAVGQRRHGLEAGGGQDRHLVGRRDGHRRRRAGRACSRAAVGRCPGSARCSGPGPQRLPARKLWIAFAVGSSGHGRRRRRRPAALVERRGVAAARRGGRRRRAPSTPTTPSRSPAPTARSSPRAWCRRRPVALGGPAIDELPDGRAAPGRPSRRPWCSTDRPDGVPEPDGARSSSRAPAPEVACRAWSADGSISGGGPRRPHGSVAVAPRRHEDGRLAVAADLLEQRGVGWSRPTPSTSSGPSGRGRCRRRARPAAPAPGPGRRPWPTACARWPRCPTRSGEVIEGWVRPNGLRVARVRVPLGVIGVIYENRPNVTSDAAGLCLKAGNAAFLRGSSSAIESNAADRRLPARRRSARPACPRTPWRSSRTPAARRPSRSCSSRLHRLPDPAGRPGADRVAARARHGALRARRRRELPRLRRRRGRPRHGARPRRQRQDPALRRVQRGRDAPGPRGVAGGVPAAGRRRARTGSRSAATSAARAIAARRGAGHARRTSPPSSWTRWWRSRWSTTSTRPSTTSPATARATPRRS